MLAWLSWILALGLCSGYALWRGGTPERIVALGCLAAYAMSLLLLHDAHWAMLRLSALLIDSALAGLILLVALKSDRWWPLAATAIQVISTLMLVTRAVDHSVGPLAYCIAEKVFDYFLIVLMAGGTYFEVVRPRRLATS